MKLPIPGVYVRVFHDPGEAHYFYDGLMAMRDLLESEKRTASVTATPRTDGRVEIAIKRVECTAAEVLPAPSE